MTNSDKSLITVPCFTKLPSIDLDREVAISKDQMLVILKTKSFKFEDFKPSKLFYSVNYIITDIILMGIRFSIVLPNQRVFREKTLTSSNVRCRNEFKQVKKVKGYEVFNIETKDKLWISHFDVEFFRELEKQS